MPQASRNSAVGAFLRNSRISDSPTGAAPTNTFSKLSKCFGVASGLFTRNWTRGGAMARCRGWGLSRGARVEGRQGDTGATMVDGLHHGLEPGGVEHGHH